jgi:excalibur calcium-binding domain-containing protein
VESPVLSGWLTQPVTIGSRPEPGRERWARQEDERRDTAFQVSLARWRQRDAELRSLLAAATTQPARAGDWSEWLEPAGNEAVYWTASGAGLIEAPYVPRLRPPHHREFGRAEEPPAGPPVDTGQVAVTDRRVVFAGRTRREWPYATLIGMAHTAAGEAWLLVTSAQNVSGVAVPAPAEFRLYLALALADRAGERDAFVADLAERVEQHQRTKPRPPARVTAEQHQRTKPRPPAPATAEQAPHSPPRGRRRVQTAAALTAALASLLAIAAVLVAGGDQRPNSFSAATQSPAAPSPPPVTTSEPPVPVEQSPRPSRSQPLRQAVPPQQQPPPPPSPPTTSSPSPSLSPSPSADTVDPRFSSCDEANRNGYGPYRRDQDPEYWWYRDRNGDGVVCQP